ncbi:MAG: YdcF family protein [Spirochaetes bacterium]|nr:YdcF family protein [Spirochaetota bacterium]
MFELKKIISVFITIPGFFIAFLVITGLYGFLKKINILKFNLLIGIILYCISISFFSNRIIGLIEKDSIYYGKPEVDVIVLLGGGMSEGVSDISGTGFPSYDMGVRTMDAFRLYKLYHLPIIVTGGSISEQKEAFVVRRILIDFGVKPDRIVIEDKSRDTVENALYVKRIFRDKGYKKGLLLTSGYHLRRSEFIFRSVGLDFYSHSSGLLSEKKKIFFLYDFLPDIAHLKKSALFLKEAAGLVFYFVKYRIFRVDEN